jgi:hypothetical protein
MITLTILLVILVVISLALIIVGGIFYCYLFDQSKEDAFHSAFRTMIGMGCQAEAKTSGQKMFLTLYGFLGITLFYIFVTVLVSYIVEMSIINKLEAMQKSV